MQRISPGGFALAVALLVVLWAFLPPAARAPLALVLIAGALAADRRPAAYVNRFFSYLK